METTTESCQWAHKELLPTINNKLESPATAYHVYKPPKRMKVYAGFLVIRTNFFYPCLVFLSPLLYGIMATSALMFVKAAERGTKATHDYRGYTVKIVRDLPKEKRRTSPS
jgi:hypothetical protein